MFWWSVKLNMVNYIWETGGWIEWFVFCMIIVNSDRLTIYNIEIFVCLWNNTIYLLGHHHMLEGENKKGGVVVVVLE
jgi:hypothetical protein